MPPISARGRFLPGSLDLARVVCQVGPAVERPERRDERQTKCRQRETPGRHRRREMCQPVVRQPDRQRHDDDEQQPAVLGDDRNVDDRGRETHAEVVEDPRESDRGSRGPSHFHLIVRRERIQSEQTEEVTRERDGDRPERRGTDHRDLAPAE